MQSQRLQNKDYEEINVIKYIITIKKQFHTILKIIVSTFAIAVIISLFFSPSTQYKGKTIISLGTLQGKVIQTQEEVSDFFTALHPHIDVEKGKGLNMIILRAEGQSPNEVKEELLRAKSALLTQHESMIAKYNVYLDEQIKLLSSDLAESNERVARFNTMVNRLSPYDQAQALALQIYLGSYNAAVAENKALERSIQGIEQQKHQYKKTEVLTPPAISQNSAPANIMVGGGAGILLGMLLGIVWIFAKQWWDGNKYLFK